MMSEQPSWRLKAKNWRPHGLDTWQMHRTTRDGRSHQWWIDSSELYALADCINDAIEEYESRSVAVKESVC